MQELRLTEPMVLASVMKWCWSRLPGGVVTWDSYELFKVGENDSNFARDAFSTFIPISVDSDARTQIIFDFFDLLSAIAAHGKNNGLGGRKLSRFAGWWAFEQVDSGKGFEPGYRSWERAADATSHLFFAYLRSLSPESSKATNGYLKLPLSLQGLLQQTEYPPEPPTLMFNESTKVVMIVDTVSPTPFALLRRVKNFEYRASDRDLQQFSQYDDPVHALTDECRRVLRSISSSNQSDISKASDSTGLKDASWSRFEDIGFGGPLDDTESENGGAYGSSMNRDRPTGLSRSPNSRTNDLGRPTTPSWADFLSTGFTDDQNQRSPAPLLLPPDKVLPPINTVTQRGHSSQSHRRNPEAESDLGPGELASITKVDLDDSFWWVWISSLAGEEPTSRKAVFGRCALIETVIPGTKWLIMEEQVKGAEAAQPAPGAYIAEKKGFFSFASRKNKISRRKSAIKKGLDQPYQSSQTAPTSKVTIGPDQHARIQAAAAALQQRNREQEIPTAETAARRGRADDAVSTKTSSVFTLQPVIMSEASPAMKWASQYDKATIRAKYLGDSLAGRGASTEMLTLPANGLGKSSSAVSLPPADAGRKSPQPPHKDEPVVEEKPPAAMPPSPVIARKPVSSPPTSPPPVPHVEPEKLHAENREVDQAAQIPLPQETPAKEPERIPLPETPVKQPAASAPVQESAPEPAASVPVPSSKQAKSSPEHKKLKKRNQPGFKGIFGNKKATTKEPALTRSPPSDSSAVAAARAALEGKTAAAAAESAPKTSRFGKSKANRAAQVAPPPQRPTQPEVQVAEAEPTAAEQFQTERPRTYRDDEYDQLSRVDTDEREDADREFSKFDQDPLPDQPSFVPQETPEPSPYESHSHMPVDDEPHSQHVPTAIDHAVPEEDEEEDPPRPSTHENSLQREVSPVQVQDRWAQIRKNAAERASRQSEEQSRNTDRTDDGETSGEETIESRVARIKARVAELTGNMEQGKA